ncbi:1-acyl-sn-glycerol-3-phosphate acyltransferase [Mesobacterium sp. TK19101]|uniref:Glycerol-3-phosphate acyltransferase n=1 Tax=Mesobacterium hydrothermale TaxID=3111907 RepID=A0ABU6HJB5_9RHOB|nr:1-acyl-sn-glycerol-3-phosphate acyltransferase [Mesobacterium sp. TK19101]MEC3861533.1 1-acyl-sn-glycerol-3-phosphate acyltransferase [Mesobacterium sp. TK19101]
MTTPVTLPLWLFVLILAFATVTFASHFLFPSVRWFFRRRLERAVARLNRRLARPIQPFKLLRRQDMIQRLIYDPQVTQAIVDHARETGVREDVAFQQARRYAREIVPSFSAMTYFGFATRAAKALSQALYRVRLGRYDEAALKGVDRDATVVFVMNHRSNMDYVLVTYLVGDHSALSYAVGEWAHVWPMSHLIRSMGAFFIRRKSRNALYRRVLARYVQMATANGVTQALFPEGGLSLDGALAEPKLGLLKYLTDDLDLSDRDLIFIPVALNYDRVLEDTVLIRAHKAGTRRFQARISKVLGAVLKQLWLRITRRFHRFGYAAVSFGTPLSLRAFPAGQASPDLLAETLMARIAEVVPVLPVPLVAHLLLHHGPMTVDALRHRFVDTIAGLQDGHIHLPRGDAAYAAKVGLRALTERGIVQDSSETVQIAPGRRDLAEFYANSIRHLL